MKKTIVLMLVLALLSAVIVSAADYGLNSVSGVWTDVSGGSGITGVNTNEVRWGTPAEGQKSGLKFDGTGASSFNEGDEFLLGTLSHFNWPVTDGTAANGATLQITLAFSSPAVSPNPEFTFDFDVEETENRLFWWLCDDDIQESGIPCDDKITFPSSYGEESVQIGDKLYTIKILGFVDSFPGGSPVNQFITREQNDNEAFLVGTLSSVLVEAPQITLVNKMVNGHVEESAPGLTLYVGDPITWEYLVQNTGNVALTDITVTDDDASITVTCPGSTLAPGESMTCSGPGTAVLGQYVNTATATAKHASSTLTSDEKAAYYLGILPYCSDSDNGKDIWAAGIATDGKGANADDCDGASENLKEFYCDGDRAKHDNIKCSDYGAICITVGDKTVPDYCACPSGYEFSVIEDKCIVSPYCGDGIINQLSEVCEMANTIDNSYCPQSTTECQDKKQGTRDGFGECNLNCLCSPDSATNFQCVKDACGAACAVDADCDDSNSNTADSCLDDCTCKHEDITPLPFCGNSFIDSGEQCDDGASNGIQCTPSGCGVTCNYCGTDCTTQSNYGGPCCNPATECCYPGAPGCGTSGVPEFTPVTALVAITIAGLGLAYFRKQN